MNNPQASPIILHPRRKKSSKIIQIIESQDRTSPTIYSRRNPLLDRSIPRSLTIFPITTMQPTAILLFILTLQISHSLAFRTTNVQLHATKLATSSPSYVVASRSPIHRPENRAGIYSGGEGGGYESTYITPATYLLLIYDILSAIFFVAKVPSIWVW